MGSFPIIQEDSPLQKLATLVQNLRQQAFERSRALEEDARRREYLELNRQEATDRRTDAAARRANENRTFQYGMERDKAGDVRLAQQDAQARGQAFATDQRNMLRDARENLASVGLAQPSNERLIDVAKGRTDVGAELTQARSRSVAGREGSIVRDPRPGVSDQGFIYQPDTINANFPSGGGGMGGVNDRNMLGIANTEAMAQAAVSLNNLEDNNPDAMQRGWLSTIGRGLVGRVAGFAAGDEARDAVGNIGLSDVQTTYDRTLEQWVHNYLPNIPGFRMSVPMFNSVRRAYSVPPGERNPDIAADVRRRRNLTTQGIIRARASGLSEAQFAAEVARMWRENGATEAANELEIHIRGGGVQPGTNASGRAVGVPGVGTPPPQRRNRFLDDQ